MLTLQQVQKEAVAKLLSYSTTPLLDVELLLMEVLGCQRSYLHIWPEATLTDYQHQFFQNLLQRRLQQEPMAYILGYQEFWGLKLKVTPATLIPRPETELLVETALSLLPEKEPLKIVDLGTGTGAIALALASERPNWSLVAVDKSEQALEVAKCNAESLELSEVTFLQSDWFSNLSKNKFDVIISNPPYIAENDSHLNALHFEPVSALVAKDQGMEDLDFIINNARDYLQKSGWLLLEHGWQQSNYVVEALEKGNYQSICRFKDLAGIERVAVGNWN